MKKERPGELNPFQSFKKNGVLFLLLIPTFLNVSSPAISSEEVNNKLEPTINSKEMPPINDDYYIIGPGDILNLIVMDVEEYSGDFVVLNDGKISVPFNEGVDVNGLTLDQAKEQLTKIFSKELIAPQVQLSLFKPRPVLVSLIGEVKIPGTYSFDMSKRNATNVNNLNDYIGLPTVVSAIQRAGGITKNSDMSNIVLRRRLPENLEGIKFKKTNLNLLDLILEGNQNQNPYLFDGDVIHIKAAEKGSSLNNKSIMTNLSPNTISVIVIGEVYKPGLITLPSGVTLNQAVLAAGGLVPTRANSKNTVLVTIGSNGTIKNNRIGMNLTDSSPGANNPQLSDGDIIKVNRNVIASVGDTMGFANKPAQSLINYFTLYKLLNNIN